MARKHANTPPYVPRGGFRTVLDHMQSHKAGEHVTRETFHRRGISSHLIYPAIAALRYLNLIDEADMTTGKHTAFSRENPDRAAQQVLVKEAYAHFFKEVKLPCADTLALKQKFQAAYDLSDRVVNSALPLFQYLAQEAGIALTSAGVHAPILEEQRNAIHEPKDFVTGEGEPVTDAALLAGATAGIPLRVKHTGYQIVININVNKYTTEKDILKMMRTATRAIHLARKAGDTH